MNEKKNRGNRWTALATSVRCRHPICERCHEAASQEVHHSVPLSRGGSLFDVRNLVALCARCHAQAHFLAQKEPFFGSKNMPEGGVKRGTAFRGQLSAYPGERLGRRIRWGDET